MPSPTNAAMHRTGSAASEYNLVVEAVTTTHRFHGHMNDPR